MLKKTNTKMAKIKRGRRVTKKWSIIIKLIYASLEVKYPTTAVLEEARVLNATKTGSVSET